MLQLCAKPRLAAVLGEPILSFIIRQISGFSLHLYFSTLVKGINERLQNEFKVDITGNGTSKHYRQMD